jgi:hypothetical protein
MDIAAFKVSHSVGTDKDATALQAARAKSSSIHRGQWMKCHRRFKNQALTSCDAKVMSTCTTASQFKCQFKGASSKRQGQGDG